MLKEDGFKKGCRDTSKLLFSSNFSSLLVIISLISITTPLLVQAGEAEEDTEASLSLSDYGAPCTGVSDCPQTMDCASQKCTCRLWYQLSGPNCSDRTSGTIYTGLTTLILAVPWFLFHIKVVRLLIQFVNTKSIKGINAKGALLITVGLCSLCQWLNYLVHAYLSLVKMDISTLYAIHDGPRTGLDVLIGTCFLQSDLIIVAVWIDLASASSNLSKRRKSSLRRSRKYVFAAALIFTGIYFYADVFRHTTTKTVSTTFFSFLAIFLFLWGGNKLASIMEELDETLAGAAVGRGGYKSVTNSTTSLADALPPSELAAAGKGGSPVSATLTTASSVSASWVSTTATSTSPTTPSPPPSTAAVPAPLPASPSTKNSPCIIYRAIATTTTTTTAVRRPSEKISRGKRLRTLARRASFTILGTLAWSGGYSYARYWVGEGVMAVTCIHIAYSCLFCNLYILIDYVTLNTATLNNYSSAQRESGNVAPAGGNSERSPGRQPQQR